MWLGWGDMVRPSALHGLRQAHRRRPLDRDAGQGEVRRRQQPGEPHGRRRRRPASSSSAVAYDGFIYAMDARTGALRLELRAERQRPEQPPDRGRRRGAVPPQRGERRPHPRARGGDRRQGLGRHHQDRRALAGRWAHRRVCGADGGQGGRVYVLDNAANLHALDQKTGKQLWKHPIGTIGRAARSMPTGSCS